MSRRVLDQHWGKFMMRLSIILYTAFILFACSSSDYEVQFRNYKLTYYDPYTFNEKIILVITDSLNQDYVLITNKYIDGHKPLGFNDFDTLALNMRIRLKISKVDKLPKLTQRGEVLSRDYTIKSKMIIVDGKILIDLYESPNIDTKFVERN
jgi:hypothetical protein